MFWSHVSKLHALTLGTNEGMGMGQPGQPENLPLLGAVSCVLDPSHCRRQVSAPCSTVRKEAWGVGGLCNLAKGVYTEIQLEKQMGTREKPLYTNSIICWTLKGSGSISPEKLSFLLHSKKNRWCHTRKSLWGNPILLSLLEPTAHHSGYFKEIPWSSFLVRLLSSWQPFHLWREEIPVNSRRWRLESALGRTVKSMFMFLLWLPLENTIVWVARTVEMSFLTVLEFQEQGATRLASLWGLFSLFVPGASIRWKDIMFPSASGLSHWV